MLAVACLISRVSVVDVPAVVAFVAVMAVVRVVVVMTVMSFHGACFRREVNGGWIESVGADRIVTHPEMNCH